VLVKVGDVVKKGQTLLTFESQDLSDNLEAQEATLQTQKWDLEDLQSQYKRQVQQGASDDELKQTQKSIDKQQLNMDKTKKDIATIKENMLPPDPIVSPIEGTVTAVNITSGEQARAGSDLFDITDYQNLSVKTQVDELDIPNVKTGMKASIQLDALPDSKIEGEVSDISNEGSASNGVSLFDVTIKLNPTDGVRVGMSAEATIIINEKQDILTLPVEAVQKMGDKYVVMLPSDNSSDSTSSQDTTNKQESTSSEGNSASGSTSWGQNRNGTGRWSGNNHSTGSTGDTSNSGNTGNTSNPGFGRRGQLGNVKEVEVGVHNENYIEIVSGLSEGDEVVLPTVMASSTSNAQRDQMMQGGGFGGMGGVSIRGEFGGGMTGGGNMSGVPRNSSTGSTSRGGGQ
jgi:HlyD family secretion protein